MRSKAYEAIAMGMAMGRMNPHLFYPDVTRKQLAAPPCEKVRNTPKVGRNEPCPCGSGLKYKKCCINKATT